MKYTRNLEYTYEVIEDCAYIFNFEINKSYNLNKIATYIFLNIETSDINTLVEELFSTYDVDREAIKRDVLNLIDLFLDLNLIYKEDKIYDNTK